MITLAALDSYLLLTESDNMKSAIEDIKQEISSCVCSKNTSSKENKSKRAPSKYNLHTSTCMKGGKSMKECAIEWNGMKS